MLYIDCKRRGIRKSFEEAFENLVQSVTVSRPRPCKSDRLASTSTRHSHPHSNLQTLSRTRSITLTQISRCLTVILRQLLPIPVALGTIKRGNVNSLIVSFFMATVWCYVQVSVSLALPFLVQCRRAAGAKAVSACRVRAARWHAADWTGLTPHRYTLAAGEGEGEGDGEGGHGAADGLLGLRLHADAMLTCLHDGDGSALVSVDAVLGQQWHESADLLASSHTSVTTGAGASTGGGGGTVKAAKALRLPAFLVADGGKSPSSTARAPMNGELSPTTPAPRRKKAPRQRHTRTAPTASETSMTAAATAISEAPPAGRRAACRASPSCFSARWRLLGTEASMRKGPRRSATSSPECGLAGGLCGLGGADDDEDDDDDDEEAAAAAGAMESGIRELAVGPREPSVLGTARRVSTTSEALCAGPGLESDTSSTWKQTEQNTVILCIY